MATVGKLFSPTRSAFVLCLASACLQPALAAPPASPTIIGPIPVNSTPGAGTARDYPFLGPSRITICATPGTPRRSSSFRELQLHTTRLGRQT
jgi:hypothetical protein